MKIKELRIKNLRKISDATLKFDKPLICLYGEVQQGKSTFLDAIKILFSAGFPTDLIQHGKTEALIQLILENGEISRSFYIDKEGQIKGRQLVAIVQNKKLSASDLKKLFNPFQLNQDFLKEMTSLERKKFFVELFNVDTKEIDSKIIDLKDQAEKLRILIGSYGEIDLTEVEEPDIAELQSKEKEIRANYNEIVLQIRAENKILKDNWKAENQKAKEEIQKFNKEQNTKKTAIEYLKRNLDDIFVIEQRLTEYGFINSETSKALFDYIENLEQPKDLQIFVEIPEPEYRYETDFNTSELTEIQEQISNAKADQIKYENYCNAVKKQQEKDGKISMLQQLEQNLRDLRKQKIAKLQEYGKEIEGLIFNESGDLTFEGIANDNLSTSQIVRLGSALSKLYPDSLLDVELIDRGESLGKRIFDFIEKAEKEQKTILATIVGQRPASVPENVGVFVVENGNLI